MLSHTRVKYENMLSCFVCKYFVFFDSTIDIKKNSEDIRPNAPVFSFPVLTITKNCMLNHQWHKNKIPTFKMIKVKDMSLSRAFTTFKLDGEVTSLSESSSSSGWSANQLSILELLSGGDVYVKCRLKG
jgi:hypothetical protein